MAKVPGFLKHSAHVSNATNSPAVDRLIEIIAIKKPTHICNFTDTPTINCTIFTYSTSGILAYVVDGFSGKSLVNIKEYPQPPPHLISFLLSVDDEFISATGAANERNRSVAGVINNGNRYFASPFLF